MFLYDMETHCCGQDQVGIIRQDFKNEVKRIMADDPRAKFGKVMVHLSFKVDLSSLHIVLVYTKKRRYALAKIDDQDLKDRLIA